MVVARQLKHEDVLAALAELFVVRGPPAHIRPDNGREFIAIAAYALAMDCILVTDNVHEFERVKGLKIQNSLR